MLSEDDYLTGLHLIHQQEGDKCVRKTSSPVVKSLLVSSFFRLCVSLESVKCNFIHV